MSDVELSPRLVTTLSLVFGAVDRRKSFPGAAPAALRSSASGLAVAIFARWKATTEAAREALRGLDEMRTREGKYLREDLEDKLAVVSRLVEELAEAAVAGQQEFAERLSRRVVEIRDRVEADESLVAQELVRFASRSDVNEEVSRLRGHIGHWTVLVDEAQPCGRKLDFLLQEMNREVNTLGAKIAGVDVSEWIVGAKAELERLREQVQNVE